MIGVQLEVIKWHCGIGTTDEMILVRLESINPGKRTEAVSDAITFEITRLICLKLVSGSVIFSETIRLMAELSKTI